MDHAGTCTGRTRRQIVFFEESNLQTAQGTIPCDAGSVYASAYNGYVIDGSVRFITHRIIFLRLRGFVH